MPLVWFLLTEERQELLRRYQWQWFRARLIPPPDSPGKVNTQLEDITEIDYIMRQPPHPSRRAE